MEKLKMLAPYKNQIVYTTLFVLIAVLWMTIGFWKTIVLIVFTGIGYSIGMTRDENRSISSIIASIQAMIER
ncbi:DUF2273 domain-containing protein [Enterococcus sp. UD-01]|uniref:DUF2273 domain-containing protein n=1 Tax=Enterococcus sp. UD-01 TaxID=3373911 RepID=UPI00383973F4